MRCAICGTEIQGRPPNCLRCGTRLWYDEAQAVAQGQSPAAPQDAWPGAPGAAGPRPPYPGYPPAYPPQEGQVPPAAGYPPMYPQQAPPGTPYGVAAPPSMPYGAYAPPSMPYGAGAPPNMPSGSAPGYQMPYPPAYGQGQGQPYGPYGVGAPATIPFGPSAPGALGMPRKRRVNPLVIVLSIVAALVVIAAAGVGAIYLVRAGNISNPGTAAGTSTPTATATLAPTLLYQNAMTTPDSGWPQDQHCFFRKDGYHIVDGEICFAPIADQLNVDIKVDMTVLSGDLGAPHGIIVRHDSNHQYYFFGVDPYGHWAFFKCLASESTCTRVVDFRSDGAIHGGLKVVNTLEMTAVGSHFTFMVNGSQVGTADDSTLTTGAVGLAGNDGSEVVYTNLTITMPR